MGEFTTMAGEILFAVLPQSDVGKILGLLIIGWVALVATGRFKLEWIGLFVRQVFRWCRCKIRDKHDYSSMTLLDERGHGRRWGTCRICGKEYERRV